MDLQTLHPSTTRPAHGINRPGDSSPPSLPTIRRACGQRRAFTLIELIGVLAITSILAAAGISVGLSYLSQTVRNRERAVLEEFAEALRRSVVRDLIIPDQSGYAAQIARYCGASPATVLVNASGNARLLLIDPAVTNSGFNLPFRQTNAPLVGGGTGVLSNLRMILVSSVGHPLPGSLPAAPGGRPSAAVFSNLWSATEGTVPAGLNWAGDPYDLCIQRVQFLDLFQPVSLNHAEATGIYTNGQIRLPGMTGFSAPIGSPGPSLQWYLTGTPLVLSNAADASILSEVIQTPVTFTYEKGRWIRGTDGLRAAPGLRSGITGADFEAAVRQFLATAIPATSGAGSGGGSGGGKGKGGGSGSSTSSGPGSRASAEAVVNAMSNYIRLGALGPAQKANMSAPVNDLRAALLDYTELPNGQLNKP